jgi:lincosamide nucleotidyltransferase A/C/D/E
MMRAEDVLEVLDLLGAQGIRVWVDGGWNVDALLGAQTRPHNDLDLVIDHVNVERCRAAMTRAGFAPKATDAATAHNFVMVDAAGREVDVHLVDRTSTMPGPDGVDIYGPNGLAYEVGALDATGTIVGRAVPCCTADFVVRSHTTYEPDLDDARDVYALHERFGIPLPAMYERFRAEVSRAAGRPPP